MATTSHFPNIFDLDQLVILTLFVLEPGEIAIPGSRARCFGAIGAIWLPPRYQYFTVYCPVYFPGPVVESPLGSKLERTKKTKAFLSTAYNGQRCTAIKLVRNEPEPEPEPEC